jgi:hypothetical protein
MRGANLRRMKTIFIPHRRQLMQMAINLMLLVIVITITSAIFADSNYYKALFNNYLKSSGYHRNRAARLNDQTDI